MFTERKIAAFQNRISDLPDTPTLTASELKARFDACPEELRQALNGVCDDGKALEDRIDAYCAQTFTGEITREMLAPAVQEELDDKATQSALEQVAAEEAAAREAMQTELTQQIAQKCEIYCGSYENSGNQKTVNLGFRPAAVIVCSYSSLTGIIGGQSYLSIALDGVRSCEVEIVNNGFTVIGTMNHSSEGGSPYRYIAFKPVG
ncbi:MAG: hypothetical protein Q3Y08_11255 [Butyricicoccus sp.]|nr:hypothetical protein [Butyricicoccus sp.]